MEGRLPHVVIYDTPEFVPISDVIESLRGTMLLAQEVKPLLEILIPGLKIDELTVTVTSIQQASPLKELFAVGLAGAYQDKIGTDMPQIVHDLFGVTPPPEFDNLISLLLIVLVFYSGQFAFNAAQRLTERLKMNRQLDGLIADVAKMLERDEASIREALDKKYQIFNPKQKSKQCSPNRK
jgi:hypothetical protein